MDAKESSQNPTPPSLQPLTFIVVSAGRGTRFGGDIPKQYNTLAGKPLLFHTLAALHRHPLITRIQPVIGPADLDLWEAFMAPLLPDLHKVMPPIFGGRERQESVFNGLKSIDPWKPAWVGIHDGARPLLQQALLDRLCRARDHCPAVIAAIPSPDTIKRVDDRGRVLETLPRASLRLVQTPQVFRHDLILGAHRRAVQHPPATDDAALLEAEGQPVHVVDGDPINIKITHPSDLLLAEHLLRLGGES